MSMCNRVFDLPFRLVFLRSLITHIDDDLALSRALAASLCPLHWAACSCEIWVDLWLDIHGVMLLHTFGLALVLANLARL